MYGLGPPVLCSEITAWELFWKIQQEVKGYSVPIVIVILLLVSITAVFKYADSWLSSISIFLDKRMERKTKKYLIKKVKKDKTLSLDEKICKINEVGQIKISSQSDRSERLGEEQENKPKKPNWYDKFKGVET